MLPFTTHYPINVMINNGLSNQRRRFLTYMLSVIKKLVCANRHAIKQPENY